MTELTLKLNFPINVRVVKNLHRDFGISESPLMLQVRVLDLVVETRRSTREVDFFISARSVVAHDCPVRDCDGHSQKKDEETVGVKPSSVQKREGALDKPWNTKDEGRQLIIREGAISLSREGNVVDGGHPRNSHNLLWCGAHSLQA